LYKSNRKTYIGFSGRLRAECDECRMCAGNGGDRQQLPARLLFAVEETVSRGVFRLSCGSVFGRGERAAGSGRLSDL